MNVLNLLQMVVVMKKARKITHSKFVCLVFATNPVHLKWICKMENVLFTADANDFRKFAELKMVKNEVLAFALHIKNKYETGKYKFKINEEELLNYPLCENQQ